jgi:hypothetical protein
MLSQFGAIRFSLLRRSATTFLQSRWSWLAVLLRTSRCAIRIPNPKAIGDVPIAQLEDENRASGRHWVGTGQGFVVLASGRVRSRNFLTNSS